MKYKTEEKLNLVICAIFTLLLTGCSSTESIKSNTTHKALQGEIHIFGTEPLPMPNSYIRYHVNDEIVTIKEENKNIDGRGLFVFNKDVYIVGSESYHDGEKYYTNLCYWKNGVKYDLGPAGEYWGNIFTEITGIYVEGNDVYISGHRRIKKNQSFTKEDARYYDPNQFESTILYWKNWEEHIITDKGIVNAYDDPRTTGIYKYKDSILVTGYNNGAAVYWLNGEEHIITNGRVISTFIKGDDLYFVGHEESGDEYEYMDEYSKKIYLIAKYWKKRTMKKYSVAKYWKNGIEYAVSDGKNHAFAYTVFVDNEDVYIAGTEQSGSVYKNFYGIEKRHFVPRCWKNGSQFKFMDNDDERTVLNIVNKNDDIYFLEYSNEEYVLWINDTRKTVEIQKNDNMTNWIFSMAVDNDDVYILESVTSSLEKNKIKYWHNGTEQNLAEASEINAVSVNNNNIYILNSIDFMYLEGENPHLIGYGSHTINYWVNNRNIPISTDRSYNSIGTDICIYKNDVYIVGTKQGKGKYWKNSAEYDIPINPRKILAANDTIFILGEKDNNIYVLKNDELILVAENVSRSWKGRISLEKGEIIIALTYDNTIMQESHIKIFKYHNHLENAIDHVYSKFRVKDVIYKNGIMYAYGLDSSNRNCCFIDYSTGNTSYILSENSRDVEINDFDVKDNIIYLIGTYNGLPAVWKNKERIMLSDKPSVLKRIVIN